MEVLGSGLGIPPNFSWLRVPSYHSTNIVDEVKHRPFGKLSSFGKDVYKT